MYLYLVSAAFLCGVCNGINQYTQSKQDANGPIVGTNTGAVAGKYDQVFDIGIVSFLGIPYAKPPLGDKRFALPDPIDKWDGILLAENKSPACYQYSTRDYEWIPKDLNVSEDCLYLNIWRPTTPDKLSVMVWIHGGGSFAGSASMDLYDGSILAALGNVIVVSMNYRLGLFGYLNGGTKEAPGNAGLFDQLLALKWVKSNIENFGGDAQNITIFGWSAGSMSVGLHLISPLSRGLFQGAIMESSSVYTSLIDEDSEKSIGRAIYLAKEAGCADDDSDLKNNPDEVIDCLKQKSASELADIDNKNTSKFPSNFRYHFGSNCDGCNPFLPDRLVKMLKQPIQVPIIVGTVSDEATALFLNYAAPEKFPLDREPDVTLEEAKGILKKQTSQLPGVSLEDVYKFYFGDVSETDKSGIVKALSNAVSDLFITCPSLYLAENAEQSYLYWFSHRSEKDPNAEWVGVPHITEVFYVFGKPMKKPDEFTDEDRIFSAQIMEIWSSFADNYYPVSEPSWTGFQSSNPKAYNLNPKNQGMIPFPRKEACELWRPAEIGSITD